MTHLLFNIVFLKFRLQQSKSSFLFLRFYLILIQHNSYYCGGREEFCVLAISLPELIILWLRPGLISASCITRVGLQLTKFQHRLD